MCQHRWRPKVSVPILTNRQEHVCADDFHHDDLYCCHFIIIVLLIINIPKFILSLLQRLSQQFHRIQLAIDLLQ